MTVLEPPAMADDLVDAGRRGGGPLPTELIDFYRRADGTVDHTPPENGWTRFWSVRECRAVRSLELGPLYAEIAEATLIADDRRIYP